MSTLFGTRSVAAAFSRTAGPGRRKRTRCTPPCSMPGVRSSAWSTMSPAREAPGLREAGIGALAARHQLEAEALLPQAERLVEVGDAEDDVGEGERIGGERRHEGRPPWRAGGCAAAAAARGRRRRRTATAAEERSAGAPTIGICAGFHECSIVTWRTHGKIWHACQPDFRRIVLFALAAVLVGAVQGARAVWNALAWALTSPSCSGRCIGADGATSRPRRSPRPA